MWRIVNPNDPIDWIHPEDTTKTPTVVEILPMTTERGILIDEMNELVVKNADDDQINAKVKQIYNKFVVAVRNVRWPGGKFDKRIFAREELDRFWNAVGRNGQAALSKGIKDTGRLSFVEAGNSEGPSGSSTSSEDPGRP